MTDEWRRSRGRRLLASSAATAGARVVTVLCSFVAMPICLKYLGTQGFGVWAALTSVISLMAFADLGIGNGILNMMSAAVGRDDTASVRRLFVTACVLLSGIGCALLVLFLALSPWVDFTGLLGVSEAGLAGQVGAAALVLAVLLALNLPSGAIQRLQFALQAGYLNGLSQAVGGVLSLLLVWWVSKTDLGLPGMVGATVSAPLLTLWASGVWMALRMPGLRPSVADFDARQVRSILVSGGQFLMLGLVFCVCQLSDNLLVANLMGADQAALFAVHQKYVSPIVFIGGLALTPLWAAYAEANARGDTVWVRRMFLRSLWLVLGVGIGFSGVLLALLEPMLQWWMRGRIGADHLLAAALMVWVSVELLGKAVSIFLHGAGLVGQQVWVALVFLPVCLAAKVVFGLSHGAAGLVLGTAAAYVLVHAFPYARLVRQWWRTHGQPAHPAQP